MHWKHAQAENRRNDNVQDFKKFDRYVFSVFFSVWIPWRIPEDTILNSVYISQFVKTTSDYRPLIFLSTHLTAGTLCQMMLFIVSQYIHLWLVWLRAHIFFSQHLLLSLNWFQIILFFDIVVIIINHVSDRDER